MKRLLFILSFTVLAFGQTGTDTVKPDGTAALEHIRNLSSDLFWGRMSGTDGYRNAAKYVADKMIRYGLKPGGEKGTFFQSVPLKDWKYTSPPAKLEFISPLSRKYVTDIRRDFQVVYGSASGSLRAKLAFAAFGIAADSWNDYGNIDVKNRIVLVLAGVPSFLEKKEAAKWGLAAKTKAAAERGAAGLVLIETDRELGSRFYRHARITKKDDVPKGFFVLHARRHVLDDLYAAMKKSWKYPLSILLREKKTCAELLEAEAEIEAHTIWEDKSALNVIGILPGSDRKFRKECLVIGAHLDHFGIGADGFLYPGADDNASGVAVLLELARSLQAAGYRPKRTILFAAWAGEEIGIRGSSFFVQHPPKPLDQVVLYLNVDMVGGGDDDLYIGGMWEFSELFSFIKKGISGDILSKIHPRLNYRGSDHSAFSRRGVPWLSLRTGALLTRNLDDEHPEYHQPGDLCEYIRPEVLETAARFEAQVLKQVADAPSSMKDPLFHAMFLHRDATVVDMHCDTIDRYLKGEDLTKELPSGHIDIPKLKQGAVDLQVFACFAPPPKNEKEKMDSAHGVFRQIDGVHRLVEENSGELSLVLSPEDISPLRNDNRSGILIGIEGGYAIENDLSLLRSFYRSGVRLMTLTHWTATDWADASGDEAPLHGGLTEFGEQVVGEMNRLGMIIDLSHVHDETFWDVIKLSKAPVVASHSCCRALSDFHRNLSDEMLKALAKNGGVMGINYAPFFLNARLGEAKSKLLGEIAEEYGLKFDGWEIQGEGEQKKKAMVEFQKRVFRIEKEFGKVTAATVVDHIEHVIRITGNADHVGLGSDFDGINETPEGLEHIGLIPCLTREMLKRGLKEEDIKKILGGNFLRVFREVVKKSREPDEKETISDPETPAS